jgi:hypothetical protein
MSKLLMDYPPPQVDGPKCQACEGLGVTSDRYQMPTAPAGERVLLIDVFCPACGGCGSADPEHRSCKPEAHADPEELGLDLEADEFEDLDEEAEEALDRCPSCQGRTWIVVLGFDQAAQEGRDDGKMLQLRVPCGCVSEQLREVTD